MFSRNGSEIAPKYVLKSVWLYPAGTHLKNVFWTAFLPQMRRSTLRFGSSLRPLSRANPTLRKQKILKIHKKFTFSNSLAFQNEVLLSSGTWHIRRQKSGNQNLISALILRNPKIPENPRRSRLFRCFVDNTRLLVACFVEK